MSSKSDHSIATIFSIGMLAWIFLNSGHELIGHGLPCIILGSKIQEVSSSFVIYNQYSLSFAENKIVLLGGVLFNLIVAILCYLVFKFKDFKSIHLKYFLWISIVFNLFYTGSYLFGWFIGNQIDTAQFLNGFKNQILIKSMLTICGLGLILSAIRFGSKTIMQFINYSDFKRIKVNKKKILLIPYVSAIFIKLCSIFMNRNFHSQPDVLIYGALGTTAGFLVWIFFINTNYVKAKKMDYPVIPLYFNPIWLVIGFLSALLYVFLLGRSIVF